MTEAAANTDIDDGLTPEEREAINSNDDIIKGDDNGATASGEDDGAGAAGDPPAEPAAAAADATQPAENAEAGATSEPEATPEPDASAPILVVQPPADAEAKLAEISTQKESLHTKFDDGDITAKEYQQQLDALNKQERDIELDLREAKLAEKMEAQRQANDWKATVDSFIAENPRYNATTAPRMYQMLDMEVRAVATSDEFKGRTDMAAGREILKKAHENLAKELGFDPTAGTKKPTTTAGKKADVAVPSLHNVPAADMSDTGEGKYAALDRLQTTNPLAYEEALMKMPQAERDAYLASA